MALKPKDLKKLKGDLLDEKKSLEKELEDLEKNPLPDFGSETESSEEEVDETAAFGNRLGLIQFVKNRLADINDGLKKIIAGDYGRCEKCGGEISLKVFLVSPSSKLCQDCKRKGNERR